MTYFSGSLKEENMSMFTDLYELTMGASYFDNSKFEPATFDLFVRRLPENRGYLLFAGLEQTLLFLENIKFTEEHLAFLKKQGFDSRFLDYLRGFKFTGDVWAMPEGTVTFPCEPLIRVTAPIIEAQLVETFLLNTVNLQTMIATKASRVVHAAKGKGVVEFGLRREHGIDAGMKVARCSYIAGCQGTSNVLAGMQYGIPLFGTMAHSFVMSFEKEVNAFRAFAKTFPDKSTLLIDTYNDLASGDLDEYRIEELLRKGAKIDAFGVGTRMGTSADKPYVDVIYKLCETQSASGEFSPIMKLSEGKITLPGRKQVYRFKDDKGGYEKDTIALANEKLEAEPLLIKIMEKGRAAYEFPSLNEVRSAAKENLSRLPGKYKKLIGAMAY